MRWPALVVAALSATTAAAADDDWRDEPARYFADEDPDVDVTYLHYGPFGQGFETGFAIGRVCDDGEVCTGALRETVIRVARRAPTAADDKRPSYDWLETSLDRCPAARDRLMHLPDARWAPHMRLDLQRDRPTFEDMRFTTFEGQLTVVTAAAGQHVTDGAMQQLAGSFVYRGNADGSGNPADWGAQMLRDVEPCLKPSSAPPPWTREPRRP